MIQYVIKNKELSEKSSFKPKALLLEPSQKLPTSY
jgi:hypothetical protein